jgi:hypothetical protein
VADLSARFPGLTARPGSHGGKGPACRRRVQKALGEQAPSDDTAQAALDAAELRAFERLEYYGEAPAIPEPGPVRRRSIVDRLFRRHRPTSL